MAQIWNCVYLTVAEHQSFAHNRNAASDRLKLKKPKVDSVSVKVLLHISGEWDQSEQDEVMTYFCFIVACEQNVAQPSFWSLSLFPLWVNKENTNLLFLSFCLRSPLL